MLVLTRKRTEKIMIGDDVVITVIHTSSGSVKLGIQAPSNVRVLRAELNERPAMVADSKANSADDDLPETQVFSADRFLAQFSSDDVAELEDQALMCLAK